MHQLSTDSDLDSITGAESEDAMTRIPEALEAIEAIESLPELVKTLNRHRAEIADEAEDIIDQWDGLGRAGGQREDHAAALLARLRGGLLAMAQSCTVASAQIDAIIADPFGRGSE